MVEEALTLINQIILQTKMDELMSRIPPPDDDSYYLQVIETDRRARAMWQNKVNAKAAKKEGIEDES